MTCLIRSTLYALATLAHVLRPGQDPEPYRADDVREPKLALRPETHDDYRLGARQLKRVGAAFAKVREDLMRTRSIGIAAERERFHVQQIP